MNSQLTDPYWLSLPELLNPNPTWQQNLPGFDDEFVDIVDYILRITYRIWEQKDIAKCYDYYASHCPVHVLAGYSDSVQQVVDNTLKTLNGFPDRSLLGESVIWRQRDQQVYYTSHRITSVMTHRGESEFGPATGRTGRVTTIADCICIANKISYEWLVRDNSFLLSQLHIPLVEAAKRLSQIEPLEEFTDWINREYAQVKLNQHRLDDTPAQFNDWNKMMGDWLVQLLQRKSLKQINRFYHANAQLEWPGGRHTVGYAGISGVLVQWLSQFNNVSVSLDHIAVLPAEAASLTDASDSADIAIRWSLAGEYKPHVLSDSDVPVKPCYVLAASHFKIVKKKIIQEWTVFDEVAILANYFRDLPRPSHNNISVLEANNE